MIWLKARREGITVQRNWVYDFGFARRVFSWAALHGFHCGNKKMTGQPARETVAWTFARMLVPRRGQRLCFDMFLQEPSSTNSRKTVHTIGPQIITYTILGFPYYNYKYIGPPNPILIIKAPRFTSSTPKRGSLLRGSCGRRSSNTSISTPTSKSPWWQHTGPANDKLG